MFKVGDRVKINFISLIKEEEKRKRKKIDPSVLKLWKAINGKEGLITEIVSDDEIWVRGFRTQRERMFNKFTLLKID